MKKYLLAAATAVTISGGSVTAANAASFDINSIIQATQADLAAADADASQVGSDGAMKDPIAHQCYAGAAAYFAAHPAFQGLPPAPIGVISGFQSARDVVKSAQGATAAGFVPQELVMACGPLALDVQNDLGHAATNFAFLGLHF